MKIKIDRIKWEIVEVKPEHPVLNGNWGMCVYTENKIYIANNIENQNKKYVILHELTHAMLAESGWNLTLKDLLKDNYELFVDAFSKQLDCLKDLK